MLIELSVDSELFKIFFVDAMYQLDLGGNRSIYQSSNGFGGARKHLYSLIIAFRSL